MKKNIEAKRGKQTQPTDAPPAPPSGLPLIVRWFLSKTVRHAVAMRKHVSRLLAAQRDILSAEAIATLERAVEDFQQTLRSGVSKAALLSQMESLENAANNWLKPYPNAVWRENVEVFLVALAVAMGIRTFFLQPFKIPTGSMQPTLYGVTSTPDFSRISQTDFEHVAEQARLRDSLTFPSGLARFREWFEGFSYVDLHAKRDGVIENIEPPFGLPVFYFWQKVRIAGESETIFFPPDYGSETLQRRAGVGVGQPVRAGDSAIKLKVQAGDHLFVDRLTYNFRKPRRGEIVVFATAGMDADQRDQWHIPGDQFYIKRMVATGGENVRVGKDQHLVINGKRLDASTPGFENVYGWRDLTPTNDYYGHIPVERFADNKDFDVHVGHFLVMGDNTRNSLDSRYFGEVDENSIIGRSSFVYWPITKRFGLGYR